MNILDSSIQQQILDKMPCGILVTDNANLISFANAQILLWLGTGSADLLGKSPTNLDPQLAQCLFAEGELQPIEGKDGNKIWLDKTISSAQDCQLHFYQDVSEKMQIEVKLTQLTKELNSLSVKDNVTGLMNQPLLMLALEPQVSRSRRYQNPISVMVMGLGPTSDGRTLEGDHLAQIAQFLKGQLRWADLIGRSEEGDFILVLPETKLDAAQQIAQKLANVLPTSLADLPVFTPLFGLAEWQKTDNATSLVRRAQQDLERQTDDLVSTA